MAIKGVKTRPPVLSVSHHDLTRISNQNSTNIFANDVVCRGGNGIAFGSLGQYADLVRPVCPYPLSSSSQSVACILAARHCGQRGIGGRQGTSAYLLCPSLSLKGSLMKADDPPRPAGPAKHGERRLLQDMDWLGQRRPAHRWRWRGWMRLECRSEARLPGRRDRARACVPDERGTLVSLLSTVRALMLTHRTSLLATVKIGRRRYSSVT